VLVLVIDLDAVAGRHLRDTIGFHRHPGQHGNDPMQFAFHGLV
jgi:hypothetical protein